MFLKFRIFFTHRTADHRCSDNRATVLQPGGEKRYNIFLKFAIFVNRTADYRCGDNRATILQPGGQESYNICFKFAIFVNRTTDYRCGDNHTTVLQPGGEKRYIIFLHSLFFSPTEQTITDIVKYLPYYNLVVTKDIIYI